MTDTMTCRVNRQLAALTLVALASGCSAPTKPDAESALEQPAPELSSVQLKDVSARALPQCAGIAAGVVLVSKQRAQRLGARQMLMQAERSNPPAEPNIPVAKHSAYAAVISRGSQVSGGYRFEYIGAKLQGDELELSVVWHEPAPGSMQATVMTNPCLVVNLPPGAYDYLVVKDQHGTLSKLQLN